MLENKEFDGGGPYFVNNVRTLNRVRYACEKEPMTQTWVRDIPPGALLWDIGANIGIFTLLAAKTGKKVVSFEPLYSNYYILCKTVENNPSIWDAVTILPVALSDQDGVNVQSTVTTEAGYSGAQFGKSVDVFDNISKPIYKSNLLGLSGDSLSKILKPERGRPNYIKIDVDGIELDILNGLKGLLGKRYLKSILVESNDLLEEKKIKSFLSKFGFYLHEREKASLSINDEIFNLIFLRKKREDDRALE